MNETSNEKSDEPRKVEYVEVAGVQIPAWKVVCMQCTVLDLGTTFDITDEHRWIATCSRGHKWDVTPEDA